MRRLIIGIVLLLVLAVINYPKAHFEVGEETTLECECIGPARHVSEERHVCFGVVYGCERQLHSQVQLDERRCEVEDCGELRSYLGYDQSAAQPSKKQQSRINLLLVLDSSLSMQGSKMGQTRQAARALLRQLRPGDRAGIVSFNVEAELVRGFSPDKEGLISSLDEIGVIEGTRYLPALDMALDQFETVDEGAENIMLFLSDGEPRDDAGDIRNRTKTLKSRGIDIYTVWVGDTSGTEHSLLTEMSGSVDNVTLEDFHHQEEFASLNRSFSQIYESVKEEQRFFTVEKRSPQAETYNPNEKIPVSLKLYSQQNDRVVPGHAVTGEEVFCAREANVTVTLNSRDHEYRVPLEYSPSSYKGSFEGVEPANYSLFAHISVSYGEEGTCAFNDTQEIGELHVAASQQTQNCKPDCSDLRDMVKGDRCSLGNITALSGISAGKVLVAVDTSDSMQSPRFGPVREAVSYGATLFSRQYEVGLIGFADAVHTLEPPGSSRQALLGAVGDMPTGGTTRYLPVFRSLSFLFADTKEGKGRRALVLISDGAAWDQRRGQVHAYVSRLIDEGVCIYTIGHGRELYADENRRAFLQNISRHSQNRLGCGRFIEALSLTESLRTVFFDLRGETQDELFLDYEISSRELEEEEPLLIHSRVYTRAGCRAPSTRSIGGEEHCMPAANVSLSISRKGVQERYAVPYYQDGRYSILVSELAAGRYELALNATVGTEGCRYTTGRSFALNVTEQGQQALPGSHIGLYLALNVLLLLLALYALLALVIERWASR